MLSACPSLDMMTCCNAVRYIAWHFDELEQQSAFMVDKIQLYTQVVQNMPAQCDLLEDLYIKYSSQTHVMKQVRAC